MTTIAFVLAAGLGPRILLAPEDGTGQGSGAASAAAAGGGGDQQAAAAGQAPGGASSPYRPEGLPDHLYGASEREIVDKLWGAYKPARDAIAKHQELGELPADPTKYSFEPSDKLKPYAAAFAEDPVFKMVQEAAHKAGIRDKQFAPFLSTVMEAMIDGELVQPPVDLAAELEKLVPADAKGLDEAAQKAAVDKRVRQNHAALELWKGRGLDAGAAELLGTLLDSAAGNQAIEFFAKLAQTTQPALGGQAAGGFTEADLDARQRDPRNRVGGARFDAAFAAETDRMFKQFYGE